jgi:hypothetical protein
MIKVKRSMYLTPAEVAERLMVNIGTLANWRVVGYGPKFMKFGRKVMYAEREIIAFEKLCEHEDTSAYRGK